MSFGAAPGGGGMDEYQRLMAERNAAAKKKRMLFGLIAVAGLGAVGYYVIRTARRTKPRSRSSTPAVASRSATRWTWARSGPA